VASFFFTSVFSFICPWPSEPFKERIEVFLSGTAWPLALGEARLSRSPGGWSSAERPSCHPPGPAAPAVLTISQPCAGTSVVEPSRGLPGAEEKTLEKACSPAAQRTALAPMAAGPGICKIRYADTGCDSRFEQRMKDCVLWILDAVRGEASTGLQASRNTSRFICRYSSEKCKNITASRGKKPLQKFVTSFGTFIFEEGSLSPA